MGNISVIDRSDMRFFGDVSKSLSYVNAGSDYLDVKDFSVNKFL